MNPELTLLTYNSNDATSSASVTLVSNAPIVIQGKGLNVETMKCTFTETIPETALGEVFTVSESSSTGISGTTKSEYADGPMNGIFVGDVKIWPK